jgi:hypothetical protein
MITPDDKDYIETKRILLGQKEMLPIAMELRSWLKGRYGVNMVNFECGCIKEANRIDRYRLGIILDRERDVTKMQKSPLVNNPAYERDISAYFIDLAKKYDHTGIKNPDKFFICYHNFSNVARTDATWNSIKKNSARIRRSHKNVWGVECAFDSAVVFYKTVKDVEESGKNGVSRKIRKLYFDTLKEYDEFGYFTMDDLDMVFDSKENLDKNYQGRVFYYFR